MDMRREAQGREKERARMRMKACHEALTNSTHAKCDPREEGRALKF